MSPRYVPGVGMVPDHDPDFEPTGDHVLKLLQDEEVAMQADGIACTLVDGTPEQTPADAGKMFWVGFAGDGHCSIHEPPCEHHLYVVCPDGAWWDIDGRANNCTKLDDKTHRCWVRHGEPPDVTVDKNGNTCAAGAGSIQTGGWHGFLRGGKLVTG